MNYNSKVIIACDFKNKKELFSFLDKMKGKKLFLKLGMQLLYQEGFEFIKELKELGHNIFIDLKINDIPNTSKNAILSLAKYNPDFITVHGFNSMSSLLAMQEAASLSKVKLLVVTVLTSMSKIDLKRLNVFVDVNNQVDTIIQLAKKAKIYGIVSSPKEASIVKKNGLCSVTPGIRLDNKNNNDQKRVTTPSEAIANGADFLVIGRTITTSNNPYETLNLIEKQKEK